MGAEEQECRRKLEQLKVQEDSLRAAIKCEDSRDRLSGTGGMDPTPEEQEECLRQIELLQLQEKRMKALVAQRREERREMDLENSRMERQLKFMKEMAVENEEAEEAWQKEQDAKKPFSGSGRTLGAPSFSSSAAVVGGSIGGSAPPPGVAAKSAAATAAAARLFGRPPSESQGAAPGRPDPGAASCTGRIVGANNGGGGAGAMAKSNGTNTTATRTNPQMEAVRTYGPGRVLGIDEAQRGGPTAFGKPDSQVEPNSGIPEPGATTPAPKPVNVDQNRPTGNIQVRLGDGPRVVVRLNTFHTVAHIRQEVRSRQPQETRDFDLVALGPPSKVLQEEQGLEEPNLLGSAVMQKFL